MSISDKLVTIAENEQKVFDAGKKAEYDAFWDVYQTNGTTAHYAYKFAGLGWTDKTFKPKYDFGDMDTAAYMFAGSGIADLSNLPRMNILWTAQYMFFGNTIISHIGEIEIKEAICTLMGMFQNASKLITIDLLKVLPDNAYSNTFTGCSALENITFDGDIGNSISFSACTKLNHDSLMSIINHLKNFSGTTDTRTLSLGTTNLNKLTDAEKAIATQKGWTLA